MRRSRHRGDNLTPYHDPALKAARLAILEGHAGYRHARVDLADREAIADLFVESQPDAVVNLAAQAGVRHSLEKPEAYVDANVVGFLNVLEGCRAVRPRPTAATRPALRWAWSSCCSAATCSGSPSGGS